VPASAWARIRQHKIIQWALGYLAAALALTHAEELVAHAFGWPELVGQVLIVLVALGLPIAITLAWYHGHHASRHVSGAEATIIAVLLLIGAGFLWLFVRPQESSDTISAMGRTQSVSAISAGGRRTAPQANPSSPDRASIAVLPFKNFSADPAQEPFADGLSEEILNSLARIHDLKVTGRTSSFYFKGKDVDLRQIGTALNVANILEGSVRRSGNQVRITVQLNNAQTGYHEWSQAYDRPMADIFQIQEDIARSVAEALQVTLGVGEIGRQPGMTRNVDAYEAFLEGVSFFSVTTPDAQARGEQQFRKALSIDPDFGLAWGGLGGSLGTKSILNGTAMPEEALAAVENFKRLAPTSPMVDVMDAGQSVERFDWIALQANLDRLRGRPNEAISDALRGRLLVYTGRFHEAVDFLDGAKSRDPLNPPVSLLFAFALLCDDKAPAARAEIQRVMSLPKHDLAEQNLLWLELLTKDRTSITKLLEPEIRGDYTELKVAARVRPLLDRPEEARRTLHELAPQANSVIELLQMAGWAGYFDDPELVLQMTTRINSHEIGRGQTAPWVLWHPLTRSAHKLPGFKQLVREMHLPEYWRKYGWADLCHPVDATDFECR